MEYKKRGMIREYVALYQKLMVIIKKICSKIGVCGKFFIFRIQEFRPFSYYDGINCNIPNCPMGVCDLEDIGTNTWRKT